MFARLIKIANFELIDMEGFFLRVLPWFNPSDPFNERFAFLEYDNCDIILNLGSVVLNWVVLLSTIVFVIFFGITKHYCPRLNPCYERFRDSLFFNAFLRIIV
mmetsp:Transcript_13306/g.13100  ORF Transcript_13306/g.13100 Transcript_13306/m.13100 type:complete len:103 (+) Transcript_13306:160-468(+)